VAHLKSDTIYATARISRLHHALSARFCWQYLHPFLSNSIAEGVTFSQYFVAGTIASGMVNTGFQQLAMLMIPVERDFGTLKRLRGTPMPASSYFSGKAILLVTLSMLIQVFFTPCSRCRILRSKPAEDR
jgi:hypothetical protein